MMTKHVVGLTLVAVLCAGSAEAAGGRYGNRQHAQSGRIRQGVASGELTGREAARLRAEQAHNRALARKAGADGTVTAGERARIEHAQDRTSRDIYRQKHDGQDGQPGGPALKGRDARQEGRIDKGVQSGQLTAKEAQFLQRRDQRLDWLTKKLAQGGLTPQERKRLEHERDVLSKQIYHQKHDNQTSEPAPADGGTTTP